MAWKGRKHGKDYYFQKPIAIQPKGVTTGGQTAWLMRFLISWSLVSLVWLLSFLWGEFAFTSSWVLRIWQLLQTSDMLETWIILWKSFEEAEQQLFFLGFLCISVSNLFTTFPLYNWCLDPTIDSLDINT